MNRFERAKCFFCDNSEFNLESEEYRELINFFLFGEMKRDSGKGDITTTLCMSSPEKRTASITAKSSGIIAGIWEISHFLKAINLEVSWNIQEGVFIEAGTVIAQIQGDAAMILQAERAILNFLGRLSGIATETYQLVNRVQGRILIVPTRKTLWGLLDKRACVVGGGGTHRLHASSAILIKENHWALLKSRNISYILDALEGKNLGKFIEIEVENEQEALESMKVLSTLQAQGIQGVLMFDNFSPESISAIIPQLKTIHPDILFEASGGLSFDNIDRYVSTGVDILSFGFLTHSSRHFDLSLRVE